MPTESQISWRDPSGFVLREGGRIFRAIAPEAVRQVRRLLDSPWFHARVEKGDIPASKWLSAVPRNYPQADRSLWLEHDVLSFPCYPHEITALQLYDAAKLTLAIACEALEDGWVLKDASA